MTDADIKIGDVVLSLAGRDAGKYFIVMWRADNYVGLADGDCHKTDKAKRKKIKHIRMTGYFSDYIANKVICGDKVTNSELRRGIKEYI